MTEETARRPVLVVAPYPALRAGLIALLSRDVSLDPIPTFAADSATSAFPAPVAIVVDFTTGEPEDLASTVAAHPDAPLILVGADPGTDGPGLGAAPVAYVASDIDAPALAAAVHAAAAGLIVLDPTVAGTTGIHAHARISPAGEALTAREQEVLELVAAGLPNKAIARDLGISEHTAKFHVGSLLGKLGAGSRTEAVTIATRRGLLPI